MAKQEEIKEGVYALFSNCFTRGKLSGKNEKEWSDKYTKKLVEYLDSQGVVIKVERELPNLPSTYEVEDNNYLYYLGQESCVEAGYEATLPLIGE